MLDILARVFITSAHAQTTELPSPLALPFSDNLDLATGSLGGYVTLLINTFLGVLGIVFIIILLYNSFKYLTAGANPQQTADARSGIVNGIIGLLIIGATWLIARFVLSAVL